METKRLTSNEDSVTKTMITLQRRNVVPVWYKTGLEMIVKQLFAAIESGSGNNI